MPSSRLRGSVTSNGQLNWVYDRSEQPVSMSGSDTGSFVYDAHRRRVRQVINGETIYSVYTSGGAMVYRHNATTGETTDYLRLGGRTIARLATSGGATTATYTHGDHLGSPAAATNAAGALLWREDYTPFGEARQQPAANDDAESFTGHITDSDTGVVYMQARYYDPAIGRFLSNDPMGFASGGVGYFNRYAYVGNDPVNLTDPTGMIGAWSGNCTDDPTCRIVSGGGAAKQAQPQTQPVTEAPPLPNGANDNVPSQGIDPVVVRGLGRLAGLLGLAVELEQLNNRRNLLYRGLSIADVNNIISQGGVLPSNPSGTLTPEQHSLDSGNSQFISLTRDPAQAARFAIGPFGSDNSSGLVAVYDGQKLLFSGLLVYHNPSGYSAEARLNVFLEQEVLATPIVPNGALVGLYRVGGP